MSKSVPIELYSDGSCQPTNPGPGGVGYIVRYFESKEDSEELIPHKFEGVKGFKMTTNNRMEILAMIMGLELIINKVQSNEFNNVRYINSYTDSKYVSDCVQNKWIQRWQANGWVTKSMQPVKNKDLWELMTEAIDKLNLLKINLKVHHIPGHQGYEFNEECDKLAVSAARDIVNQVKDEGYEKSLNT